MIDATEKHLLIVTHWEQPECQISWEHDSLTCAGAEVYCVGEQQEGVVEEALQHGCLHFGMSQVLTADCCPTYQQWQDLTHEYSLQQTPGKWRTRIMHQKKNTVVNVMMIFQLAICLGTSNRILVGVDAYICIFSCMCTLDTVWFRENPKLINTCAPDFLFFTVIKYVCCTTIQLIQPFNSWKNVDVSSLVLSQPWWFHACYIHWYNIHYSS